MTLLALKAIFTYSLIAQQTELFQHQQKTKLIQLLAQIKATQSIPDIQAVVWS